MSAVAYGSGLYGASEYLGAHLFRAWFSADGSLWVDKTSDVRSFSIQRGRGSELDEVDAGTASLVLDNRERWYDPTFNTIIRPMNRWKLEVMLADTTIETQFVGYAESYDQQWPGGGKDAVAVVSCVDEFARLARRKLLVTSPPRDTYPDVVMFDQPHAYWRFDDESIEAGAAPTVGPTHLVTYPGGTQTLQTPSAIVGDNGTYLALGGGTVVSADIDQEGASGDVSGLAEFTCEFWFRAPAYPAGNSSIIIAPLANALSTYQISHLSTGEIQVVARNGAGTTFTITSSALALNAWYHVVATITGGSLRLYLNGTQVASTAWTSPFHAALGTDNPFQVGGPFGARDIDELAVYRRGLPATRIFAHYEAGALRGFPRSQLPGARTHAVLDAVGSQAPRRLQAGTRPMTGAFMRGQTPLAELRQAARAELPNGLLFISGAGEPVLLDNGHRSVSPWDTVQAVFGDAGGSELPYTEVDVDFGDSFLINKVTATRQGGPTQEASDATSVDAFDEYAESITDLPLTDDADALAIAQAIVSKYKDPFLRVLSLEVNTADPDGAEAVFALDIGDRIEVRRTPPGGGDRIIEVLFVQQIRIDGDARSPIWRVVLGVSPL